MTTKSPRSIDGMVPGFTFGTDSRDRRYKLETEALGQSPGPVYNIASFVKSKPASPLMGYRLPEPVDKAKVPGPGSYELLDYLSRQRLSTASPKFTFGNGREKQRLKEPKSLGPGAAAYDISKKPPPKFAAKSFGSPPKKSVRGVTESPRSPGPKYNLQGFNTNAPTSVAFSFGGKLYQKEAGLDTPGPKYNVVPVSPHKSTYVMKPPTTSPRRKNENEPESPPQLSSIPKLPEDIQTFKSNVKCTFGNDTRDRYYDRILKYTSVSPGPAWDVSNKGNIRSPRFSLAGRLRSLDNDDSGPGPAAYNITSPPGAHTKSISFAPLSSTPSPGRTSRSAGSAGSPRQKWFSPRSLDGDTGGVARHL